MQKPRGNGIIYATSPRVYAVTVLVIEGQFEDLVEDGFKSGPGGLILGTLEIRLKYSQTHTWYINFLL